MIYWLCFNVFIVGVGWVTLFRLFPFVLYGQNTYFASNKKVFLASSNSFYEVSFNLSKKYDVKTIFKDGYLYFPIRHSEYCFIERISLTDQTNEFIKPEVITRCKQKNSYIFSQTLLISDDGQWLAFDELPAKNSGMRNLQTRLIDLKTFEDGQITQ